VSEDNIKNRSSTDMIGGMDWISLAQHRDRRQANVNTYIHTSTFHSASIDFRMWNKSKYKVYKKY
jgi:hypothetical protein